MAGTNLKEFRADGTKVDYSNIIGFRDAVKLPPASAHQLIVRCVEMSKRDTLQYILSQIGVTDDSKFTIVHNDDEWAKATDNGKKTYLICSMGNFMIIGSNGWSYASGPIHKDEYIYRDTDNYSNVLFALDHIMTTIPKTEDTRPKVKIKSNEEEYDEYIFHPVKRKGTRPPQTPVYNKETCKHMLKCDVCGEWVDEHDISYTYNAQVGYTYKCQKCGGYKSPLKSLTFKEKMAKASGDDMDDYSFDGSEE